MGKYALIFQSFHRKVEIGGYDPTGETRSYDTVSAAIVYQDPMGGPPSILIMHQAIHIPHLSHNLLSLMQLRLNDVKVNEVPKFLVEKPTDLHHTISVRGGEGDDLVIPLLIHQTSSMFYSR